MSGFAWPWCGRPTQPSCPDRLSRATPTRIRSSGLRWWRMSLRRAPGPRITTSPSDDLVRAERDKGSTSLIHPVSAYRLFDSMADAEE
jgi:hypothetical protein